VGHSPHLIPFNKGGICMRCTYPDVCVYYREIGKTNIKTVCERRDGEEIKNIPAEEIENCEYHKTYKDVKWNI